MTQTKIPRWTLAALCSFVAVLCGWAATVLPWRSWTTFAILTSAVGVCHGATAALAWFGSAARARAWRVQALVSLTYLGYLTWNLVTASSYTMLVDPRGDAALRVRGLPGPSELYRAWREGDFSDWRTPVLAEDIVPEAYVPAGALLVRANFLKGMRYLDERYANSWWDLEICHQIRHASRKIYVLRDARAVLHPAPGVECYPSGVRALLAADSALAAAVFCGKHFGWWAGFRFRLQATMSAFFAIFGGRDVGYCFSRFKNILAGQRLDGSQTIPTSQAKSCSLRHPDRLVSGVPNISTRDPSGALQVQRSICAP